MGYSAKQRKVDAGVQGATKLAKELKKMGDDASNLLSLASMNGGMIALNDAKANCPVDTGKLKNSLNIKINKVSKTKADIIIDYDRKLYYGTFVELGAKGRKANPFLRNSVDKNLKKINETIVDTIRKGIK